MIIGGIKVTSKGLDNFTEEEAAKYIQYVEEHATYNRKLEKISEIEVVQCDDGKVDVHFTVVGERFERIRRITGYLVGTTDRWNDAKRAEESERVKHDTEL